MKVKVVVAIFRKKNKKKKQTLPSLQCLHLSMDFNITSHKCLSSKFNFQDAAGLKVKVTVALFRKKNVIALAPAFMNGF